MDQVCSQITGRPEKVIRPADSGKSSQPLILYRAEGQLPLSGCFEKMSGTVRRGNNRFVRPLPNKILMTLLSLLATIETAEHQNLGSRQSRGLLS
jgi:hypothetical protein